MQVILIRKQDIQNLNYYLKKLKKNYNITTLRHIHSNHLKGALDNSQALGKIKH